MKSKVSVLMIGPFTKTGGVATHTQSLTKAMHDKNLNLMAYNSSFEGEFPKIIINMVKIYKRTFGMFWFSIKRRESFKIVHIQSSGGLPGFLNAITGVIVSSILRKKLIVTFHYTYTEIFVRKYFKMVRFVLRKTNRFILISNRQKKKFSQTFSEPDKIRVIPNPYNSRLFEPADTLSSRKELGLPSDKKILINIAHLEEYKGQKYLIEAMKNVLAKRDDVMLYIVGQGSLKNLLQSLIKDYGLENNIVLAGGNKSSEEIPLWMNACDVFVFPSLRETFGIVQIEAMACGKPVVATYNGGSEEVVVNEQLGILVEPKDADGLANAILKALDKGWDKDYILNYAEQFTWDKIAEKTMEVYDEVMEK